MSFSLSFSSIQQFSAVYHENKTGKVLVKNASLLDLSEALGAVFAGLKTTDKTIPPQANYNTTVVSAVEKTGFFGFINLLGQLYDFYDADFAFCTVNTRLGSFPRPSKEEFQEFKHLYVLDSNMNLSLDDVFPIELIRAVRLHLMQLLFRFFKTYDVDEEYQTKDGKKHKTCNASNATYRSNGHTVATGEFCSFTEYLIKANLYLKQLSLELTEFSTPFREAALTAKAEREKFRKTQNAQQQTQNAQQQTQKTQKPQQAQRQVSLKKTFNPNATPFDPSVNVWEERKVRVVKTVQETPTVQETFQETVTPVESDVDTLQEGEFKLVSKKKNVVLKKRDRFRTKRS
jgi:hypothetical protein